MFQRVINTVFKQEIDQNIAAFYLDDVFIWGNTGRTGAQGISRMYSRSRTQSQAIRQENQMRIRGRIRRPTSERRVHRPDGRRLKEAPLDRTTANSAPTTIITWPHELLSALYPYGIICCTHSTPLLKAVSDALRANFDRDKPCIFVERAQSHATGALHAFTDGMRLRLPQPGDEVLLDTDSSDSASGAILSVVNRTT